MLTHSANDANETKLQTALPHTSNINHVSYLGEFLPDIGPSFKLIFKHCRFI